MQSSAVRARVGAELAQASSGSPAETMLRAIGDLERLRHRIDGMQALLEVEFRREQIRAQQEARVRREHLGRGIAEEIALARGMSPKRAGDQLALRRVLVESMPRVHALVMSGGVSGWAAEQAAQAAIVLDDDDRDQVDRELAPRIAGMKPSSVKGAAQRIADRLDQESAVRRLRRAESERHVSIRPVADGMVRLSALLPARAGVATFAALHRHAATARASGDPRSKGQMMADALVERITGLADAAEAPVEIQLVMTDRALLTDAPGTALLEGHPIPAEAARALALHVGEHAPAAVPARFLRRLFTDPSTGSLTGMDQRRRAFTGAVREFIKARDQHCRAPFCDAPIRDIDHVRRHADGGTTSIDNGAGLCQRHNLAKEMPGWRARVDETGAMEVATPSGIRLISPVPDLHEHTGRPFGSSGRGDPGDPGDREDAPP